MNWKAKFILFAVSLAICSCNKTYYDNKRPSYLSKPDFNIDLKHKEVFKEMDQMPEVFDLIDMEKNENQIKSSNLNYTIRDSTFHLTSGNIKTNCKARIYKNDLIVNLGFNTGYGGNGISIVFNQGNQNYYIKESGYTDVIYKAKRSQEIIHQHLILDKLSYNPSDSVYGYVEFNILKKENEHIEKHIGNGYFRCKIQ
ncbi:MAG TPA: hypothetical protein VKY36_03920 [Moheibacter sp.]|nr:hypothetical protein [Moheibacter sp.]